MSLTPAPRDPEGHPDRRGPAAGNAARRRAALSAVAAAVAIAVFAPDRRSYLRSLDRFHDFLHVPGLALVAWLLLAAFPAQCGWGSSRRAGRLLAVFVATVAVGVLVELLQAALGGPVSGGDLARDAGGAAAAVLLAASWGTRMRAGARWSLRLLSLIIVGASTLPIVGALREEHRARRQFPVLADFGRAEELERFEWRDSTPGPPDAGADGGVRVALRPARYPGFALTYFPRDWRGYRQFVFTATNPSAAPLPLVIRIDDERHNQDYTDRFNAGYVLAPGRNEIRVPLAAVETAPRGRKLDLARVRQVVIFSHGLGERRDVIVESLRLEK